MIMNWYTRNVSTAADQPKQLVRNAFNHRCECVQLRPRQRSPAKVKADLFVRPCTTIIVASLGSQRALAYVTLVSNG